MNNINQYIFDIDHVLAHLRDTLEYVLPREHDAKIYEQRKTVLKKGIEAETPLGKFLANNTEQLKTTIDKYNEMLDELYGDESTILVKTNDGKIRVDHTQHVKIFDYVVSLVEPIRDIFNYHLNLSRERNESDIRMLELAKVDDRYYRLFSYLMIIQEFQKSFAEFQKVMAESQGKPTPQSNFIVQNELQKMAAMLRFVRQHVHCTDNSTLDVLDETLELVEMTEGRRDRRDDKSFPELFKANIENLNAKFMAVVPMWKNQFDAVLQEMLADIKAKEKSASQA